MNEEHRKYWNDRGVTDDILDTLNIGYKEKGDWKWFTIPIIDFHGNVLYHKLKKAPGAPDKQPKSLYDPKGQDAMLWPLPYLHENVEKIYLAEGDPDVMALLSQGQEAITSTSGAGNFDESWLKLFPTEITVMCCYDKDEAGDKGRKNIDEVFSKRPDIILQHLHLPEECPGKDMTDYLLWNGS